MGRAQPILILGKGTSKQAAHHPVNGPFGTAVGGGYPQPSPSLLGKAVPDVLAHLGDLTFVLKDLELGLGGR